MTDEDPAPDPTLLQRLVRAGIAEDKARGLIAEGQIRVEGDTPTDPNRVTPFGQRWVVAGQS